MQACNDKYLQRHIAQIETIRKQFRDKITNFHPIDQLLIYFLSKKYYTNVSKPPSVYSKLFHCDGVLFMNQKPMATNRIGRTDQFVDKA